MLHARVRREAEEIRHFRRPPEIVFGLQSWTRMPWTGPARFSTETDGLKGR